MRSQLLACASLLALKLAEAQNSSLPTVDLGYELHQARSFNSTGNFYTFANIRYAAPPLGDLRFRAPQAPAVDRSQVQTGANDRICPQATPSWISGNTTTNFIGAYLTGRPFNTTLPTPSNSSSALPPRDPRTTEDCLFLDVFVPQDVFQAAGTGYGAPVLVWIYGGGYTGGNKAGSSPAGLLAASGNSSDANVIYVALNYRLGAFGWLSGPTFQEDGTANAGLWDQRFALEWVQTNINLFGGDPNRVTVFGESAGGGSIMHQITAWGGNKGPVPFQQAIPQSPGFAPITSNFQQETTFNNFLRFANVSSIQEARELDTNTLLLANELQVFQSTYGGFTYGPTVDGDFVPALPGQLLARGQFDDSVRVMVGHNGNEGLLFTPPSSANPDGFDQYIQTNFPDISQSSFDYIANTLYPPVFDGSQPYRDGVGRVAFAVSEVIFVCNTDYLNAAYENNTYAYLFDVPPALHGQDVPFTYFDGGNSVANTTVARALQDYITNFAINGRPSVDGIQGVPQFNLYGDEANIIDLNVSGISEIRDPAANERCAWWQKALYN